LCATVLSCSSIDAIAASTIFGRSTSDVVSDRHLFTACGRKLDAPESSTTPSTANEHTIFRTTTVRLAESPGVDSHTVERHEHSIEPVVSTTTTQEWNRTIRVA
jgi:hypothetical protein